MSHQGRSLSDPLSGTSGVISRGQRSDERSACLNESLERFCSGFSCISNPFRSLYVKPQIPHDIGVSIQALFPQRPKGAEAGGIARSHRVDGVHCDGITSSLPRAGEFLESVALFTADRNLSHPPHLSNGIEVSAIGRLMKIGPGDCDTDCIECFFHLLCSTG
jgi:hypothetical protein